MHPAARRRTDPVPHTRTSRARREPPPAEPAGQAAAGGAGAHPGGAGRLRLLRPRGGPAGAGGGAGAAAGGGGGGRGPAGVARADPRHRRRATRRSLTYARLRAASSRPGAARTCGGWRWWPPTCTGRGDTDGRIALGAAAHEFSADAVELERAAPRGPAASPLFVGHDGRPYKRAYARVGPAGDVAGFVVVEASADYLAPLARFRRWFLVAGALGLGLIVLAHRVFWPASSPGRWGGWRRRPSGSAAAIWTRAVPIETARRGGAAGRPPGRDAAGAARARRAAADDAGRDRPRGAQSAGRAGALRRPAARGAGRASPSAWRRSPASSARSRYLEHVVTDFLEYARRPRPELAAVPLRPAARGGGRGGGRRRQAGRRAAVRSTPQASWCAQADRGQLRRALLNLAAQRARRRRARAGGWCWPRRAEARARCVCEVRDSGPGRARPSCARRSSSRSSPPARRAPAWAWPSCARSCATTAATSRWTPPPEGGARFRFRLPARPDRRRTSARDGPHPHHRRQRDHARGHGGHRAAHGPRGGAGRRRAPRGSSGCAGRGPTSSSPISRWRAWGASRWPGRSRSSTPTCPVMIVTAFGTVETAVEAMRLGAFDFLQKPFAPEVVRLKVERALELRGEKRGRAAGRGRGRGPARRRRRRLPRAARSSASAGAHAGRCSRPSRRSRRPTSRC